MHVVARLKPLIAPLTNEKSRESAVVIKDDKILVDGERRKKIHNCATYIANADIDNHRLYVDQMTALTTQIT